MADSKHSESEDEFEILMDTLAHLEDMLFEEISLGDDDEAWNLVASKSGEGIREELKEFEERFALPAFSSRGSSGLSGNAHGRSASEGGAEDSKSEVSRVLDRETSRGDGVGFEQQGTMFSVEQYELHKRFASIVESHLEKYLGSKYGPNSAEKLIEAIRKASANPGACSGGKGTTESGFQFVQNNWARDAGREVLSLLREVDDFEFWAQEMTRKASVKYSADPTDRYAHK